MGNRTHLPIGRIAGAIVLAGVVVTPLLLHSSYLTTTGVLIGINAIIGVGLGLLMGYAGQVSLGHAAFYGLGAYCSALLTTRAGLAPLPAMAVGMVLTGTVALIVGAPTLRLHGHYLAMFTLGLGIIAQVLFTQNEKLTGGFSGLSSIPHFAVGRFSFDTDAKTYLLVLAVLAGTLLLARNLVNSRPGRALRALHESEVAAATCGVDVARAKLQVFVLSAVLASVAGSLYAHFMTFVSPEPFGFHFSVQLVVMVTVGGVANVWGPVAGAALFTVLTQFLAKLGDRVPAVGALETLIFGAVLVVVVIFLRQGLVSLPEVLRARTARGGS